MIYSIINKKSFMEINRLRDKILRIKDKQKVPMVLMGNKCDLETERQVSKKEGEDLAASFGVPFFEASAKNHLNIDESFHQLVREIRKYRKLAAGPGSRDASAGGLGKKKKGCVLF